MMIARIIHPSAAVFSVFLATSLTACMEGPTNGDTTGDLTPSHALSFNGRHTKPNEGIYVQVLAAPDDPNQNDFTASGNWTTIASTATTTTPQYFGSTQPYYTWSIPSMTLQNALVRWPQGGILRVRAVDSDGINMATFNYDWLSDCHTTHTDWFGIGQDCKTSYSSAAIVSTTPAPEDAAVTPKYLSYLEGLNTNGSATETGLYYTATAAAPNLPAFKTEYGFGAAGSDEVSATYFNAGDLGIGREMHCKSFQKPGMASPGRACYVSNYGAPGQNFGVDPTTAVNNAVQGTLSGVHAGAFATVTMAYYPPITSPNSVRFAVYGPDDSRVNAAQLDTKGYNKGIPQNCIVCHGGASYDSTAHAVSGARFLPFDLASFQYSTTKGFTRADQEEKLRKLNEHVYATSPTLATQHLIEGWYAPNTVHTVNAVANTDFVPSTFSNTADQAKVYREVVAPYCRTCHASQTGTFDFTDGDAFAGLGVTISSLVCDNGVDPTKNHVMPNSEVTGKRFWTGRARAFLIQYLGIRGTCKPSN